MVSKNLILPYELHIQLLLKLEILEGPQHFTGLVTEQQTYQRFWQLHLLKGKGGL